MIVTDNATIENSQGTDPVTLTARGNISISNGGAIETVAQSTAHGYSLYSGPISIQAGGDISILNGGLVESSTGGGGTFASGISVTGGAIMLDGGGSMSPTGVIISGSLSGANGAGPDVSLNGSGPVSIKNGATIAADSFGATRAGVVQVSAGGISLDSGSITAQTFGIGPGGQIGISATSLSMTDSTISANSYGGSAEGGRIVIAVPAGDVRLDAASSISATSGGGLGQPLTVSVQYASPTVGTTLGNISWLALVASRYNWMFK